MGHDVSCPITSPYLLKTKTPMTASAKQSSRPGVFMVGNYFLKRQGNYAPTQDLLLFLEQQGYPIISAPHTTNKLARLAEITWKALRYQRRYQVAIIELYSGMAFLWAEWIVLVLRLLGKRIILNPHGGNLPTFARGREARLQRLMKAAAWVVTPSYTLQTGLREFRADMEVLPNALDLARYPFHQRTSAAPRLVWLRAFHHLYRPDIAVQALGLLKDDFPDLTLTMVGPDKGDGSYEGLWALARELGVEVRLSTPGAVAKASVPDALAPHDIFLNTTTAESFGISVMEAAALGLCIITTNVGELPFIWTHEDNALMTAPGDAQVVADAIRRVLTDPALAARLSQNARAKAEQYGFETIMARWIEGIERVVKG